MLVLVTSGDAQAAPRSQASAAYVQLKREIVSGRRAPGEKLKIVELANGLDVSPGAIREALSRLVPEQLVVSRDQKGFVVAPLSIEDLEDLTDLRCEIEQVALRRSVTRGDASWEAGVLAAAHRLRRTPMSEADRSLKDDWVGRHEAFHLALVSACGSPRMLALHTHLYQLSERYRGLSVHTGGERDVAGEHQRLVDAALDRDADGLVGLMVDHIRETSARIIRAAQVRQVSSLP